MITPEEYNRAHEREFGEAKLCSIFETIDKKNKALVKDSRCGSLAQLSEDELRQLEFDLTSRDASLYTSMENYLILTGKQALPTSYFSAMVEQEKAIDLLKNEQLRRKLKDD